MYMFVVALDVATTAVSRNIKTVKKITGFCHVEEKGQDNVHVLDSV